MRCRGYPCAVGRPDESSVCQLALGSLCASSRGILGCTSFNAKSARSGFNQLPQGIGREPVQAGQGGEQGPEAEVYEGNVPTTNKAGKELVKKHSNREVRWEDIRKKARVKKGHRSSLLKAFRRGEILVAARRPRENPTASRSKKAKVTNWRRCLSTRAPGIT